MHNTKGKGAEQQIKHAAALQRKPARREKKAIRKRVSADAFSRRAFLSLRVFLFRSFGNGGLSSSFVQLHSGLFLGVSLSAAARSAAALVYDKLTPNCHLLLNAGFT